MMCKASECQDEAGRYNLVFACSGASDVGEIADQAARQLSREEIACICATAAIAAGIPEILEKAAGATRIIAIDGCNRACARKILDRRGLPDYAYVALDDLGMVRGKTPATDENIAKAVFAAVKAFAKKATE
ncbi:MAG: putative zinc-binding protein [Candidatus Hydrogenedentes bacterium]|nr:putative zinc-binding protein [Candidatus Hydrogenedentota bacterium]